MITRTQERQLAEAANILRATGFPKPAELESIAIADFGLPSYLGRRPDPDDVRDRAHQRQADVVA